ncbi:MAG: primosomal protein N' [Candidatus Omnitrophica bacterium CG11_big_fil_rev_8_21_14_0_20_42_13]|uniref:Probable replication restart protein PriA n=1 Tax=Candidatus Ghiorseimicrobium undicola TaxID=1974746 RepID=A0A2H0M0D9_9BACT|nr:MAG: primosomal protein N' [Candidatus Omnitrophica bacterium CG11_big_fil_rev_8_21_14_0_20_42_13]
MIAQVALPIPINKLFDYSIPQSLTDQILKGMRVKVPFRNLSLVGYVVEISPTSNIKELKFITSVLDKTPVLSVPFFKLAEEISANYFCSLGEAIDKMMPSLLKKGRRLEQPLEPPRKEVLPKVKEQVVLFHDISGKKWQFFKEKMAKTLSENKGVIFLAPQIDLCLVAKDLIEREFGVSVTLLHSRNKDSDELANWLKVKSGKIRVVVGTSFAVFAPLVNLGLIIIDDEDNIVYKQEQSPFFHCRDIALLRIKREKADMVLSSPAPSLESYYQAKKKKYKLAGISGDFRPSFNLQIVDTSDEYRKQKKKNIILSRAMEDNIRSSLSGGGQVMLFLNRVGFATYAACKSCGFVMKCTRCSKSLIFFYEKKEMFCGSCNFKAGLPELCPACGLDYIRYSGLGTEKLESEIYRLFPQKIILRYDRLSAKYAKSRQQDIGLKNKKFDILITTQVIINELHNLKDVALVGILSLDALLNRIDFRAAEKTYQLLLRLVSCARQKVVIQTNFPEHYMIRPLSANDYGAFYKKELKYRKELLFPPLAHLASINLRGRHEEKVRLAADELLGYLKREISSIENNEKDKHIELSGPAAAMPLKLRGNFRYNILVKSKSRTRMARFLNNKLRNFKKSGIIITVDIDPL